MNYHNLLYRCYVRVYDKIIELFPPKFMALLDLCLRPDFRYKPLNAQERRKELFDDLAGLVPFEAIVETGTFCGATTEYFARHFKIPVFTTENNSRFYYSAYFRLKKIENVKCFYKDSRLFLKGLGNDTAFPKKNVLFYLDAHWQRDLPLREEVRIIKKFWSESIIIIDDFQVPDDPGYSYDDYGGGKKLCLEYLKEEPSFDFEIFWPSAKSGTETIAKPAGSIVLATRDRAAELIRGSKLLRQIPL